jgi:hypothetical protein
MSQYSPDAWMSRYNAEVIEAVPCPHIRSEKRSVYRVEGNFVKA